MSTLSAPASDRSLARARIALGVMVLLRTTPLLHAWRSHAPFAADTFPLLGWPDAAWTVPIAGLALPAGLVSLLCVVRTVAAVAFTFGVRARSAGLIAAASGSLVLAQDRFAVIDSLQIMFLATGVLALTGGTRALALRPEGDASAAAAASSVRLVTLFLASIYFWAAVAKLQPDWLSGRALEAQAGAGAFAGPLGAWIDGQAAIRSAAAWLVPALELTLAALLVTGRRRSAIVLALAFHVGLELIVNPDLLGWQMAALLLGIWPQRPASRASLPPAHQVHRPPAGAIEGPGTQRVALAEVHGNHALPQAR